MNASTRPNAVGTALDTIRRSLLSPEMKHKLAVALSGKIDAEKFAQVAMVAISKNADLVNADRDSLFIACMEAAADGLLPNGKDAALVAYGKKVQYQPMVKGVYKIAQRSGAVKLMNARVVYAGDLFKYSYGFEPMVEHVPAANPGQMTHVYAVIIKPDGARDLEVMTKGDVDLVRSKAKAPNSPAWKDHYTEMARKTVIHRIAKRLDLTPELDNVVSRIETNYDFDNEEFDEPHAVEGTAPRQEDFEQKADATPQPEPEPMPVDDYVVFDEVGEKDGLRTASGWAEEIARRMKLFGDAGSPKRLQAIWDANETTIDRLTADGETECVVSVRDYFEKWKAHLEQKPVSDVREEKPKATEEKKEEPRPPQAKQQNANYDWIDAFIGKLGGVKTDKALGTILGATFKDPLEALKRDNLQKHAELMVLVDEAKRRLGVTW